MESSKRVVSYDGQTVWLENRVPLYEVGNFLGGGAAGTVYEAENVKTKEHFALKILNPLGYKMLSPSLLRRCTVITKGKPVSETIERSKGPITKENVWWLLNGSTKQYIVAYYSERQRSLHELSLVQCMNIWGVDLPEGSRSSDPSTTTTRGMTSPSRQSPSRNNIPLMPPKYEDFVRRRARIFREIYNMRKISPHENVIRLENVLELAQDSKCTIFLVMELANGGELFDRIKIDCGTVEETAGKFFSQLLNGVRHCHDEGVCHRDLKPENLLLQDTPSGPILKIADFGFSARLAMADEDEYNHTSSTNTAATASSIPLYSSATQSTSPTVSNNSGSVTSTTPMRVLLSVVGSPFYVAPEVLQARGYDGSKADSWSLGVILYAMLAGNLPFSQELASCKRFRQFCIWAREQSTISSKFWQDPALVCPPWLFSVKFSTAVRGLIVAMLLPDPADRISVTEAQQHSWCRSFAYQPESANFNSSSVNNNELVIPNMESGSGNVAGSYSDDVDVQDNGPADEELFSPSGSEDIVRCNTVENDDFDSSSSPTASIRVLSLVDSNEKWSGKTVDNISSEDHALPTTHSNPHVDINSTSPQIDIMDVEESEEYLMEERDDSDQEDNNDTMGQFLMDEDSDDSESALKRCKKNPSTSTHCFDFAYDRKHVTEQQKADFDDDDESRFGEQSVWRSSGPSQSTTPDKIDHAQPNCEPWFNNRDQDFSSPYLRACAERGSSIDGVTGSQGSSSTFVSSPRLSSCHNLTTPPPTVPSDAIPYIIAGTPDLLDYEQSLLGEQIHDQCQNQGQSSSQSLFDDDVLRKGATTSPPPVLHTRPSLGSSSVNSGSLSTPTGSNKKPQTFHDAVKRSTRFITSVPAGEVLETVESILEQCRIHKTVSPIGVIGRVELYWESYRLDVWGVDASDTSPPLCSLHLYQLPSANTCSPIRVIPSNSNLNSPIGSGLFGMGGVGTSPMYLVEFVRGQLEIFAFKRFYEWIRQRVSELVKRDYAFSLFDQSGSPIQTSSLVMASSPLRPGGTLYRS